MRSRREVDRSIQALMWVAESMWLALPRTPGSRVAEEHEQSSVSRPRIIRASREKKISWHSELDATTELTI